MVRDLSLMAEFWLRWNEACEKMTNKRIRIEAIGDELPKLSEWVGTKITGKHLSQLQSSIFSNSSRQRYMANVKWEDLADADASMCERVKAKAVEYGYKELV
jgi:hypothetical protein